MNSLLSRIDEQKIIKVRQKIEHKKYKRGLYLSAKY